MFQKCFTYINSGVLQDDVICEAIARSTVTKENETELNVALGERIDILGVSENLSDWWIARNQNDETGLVSRDNLTYFPKGNVIVM